MKTKIPAGYRITSTSWENDGDCKRTLVKEGMGKWETELIGELATLMLGRGCGLENEFEPSEKVLDAAHVKLWGIVQKYSDFFDAHDMSLFQSDVGQIQDYIQDNILGPSVEGYALRVLESITIEYIPVDVFLEDVTKQFVK